VAAREHADGGRPEPPAGLRRAVRRVGLLLAFAVLCAAVAAAVWLARLSPVEFRGGSVWSERGSGPHPVSHQPVGDGVEVSYASLSERGRFTAGLDLGNTGRFDLRITGLGEVERPAGLTVELWMGEGLQYEENGMRLVPFEPFTLRPDEIRYLAVGVRLHGDRSCARGPARFRGAIRTMPLRYELLGVIHRTATITLPRALGVVCGERPEPWPPELSR